MEKILARNVNCDYVCNVLVIFLGVCFLVSFTCFFYIFCVFFSYGVFLADFPFHRCFFGGVCFCHFFSASAFYLVDFSGVFFPPGVSFFFLLSMFAWCLFSSWCFSSCFFPLGIFLQFFFPPSVDVWLVSYFPLIDVFILHIFFSI